MTRVLDALAGVLWDECDRADRLGNWTEYHLVALRAVAFLDRLSIKLSRR